MKIKYIAHKQDLLVLAEVSICNDSAKKWREVAEDNETMEDGRC